MRYPRLTLAVLGAALCTGACASDDVAREAGEPLAGLTEDEMARFLLGKAVFSRLTSVEEGLGPTYNQARCSDCHTLPVTGGSGTTENTLGKARRWENGECDLLEEEGGDLIQKEATPLLLALGYTPPEQTPAGASVRLDEPALATFGLGLIEAIDEEDILSREDPDDADGDGISGRAGRDISGVEEEEGRVGRFNRKAEWSRVYNFVDASLRTEIGLTTPRFPDEQTLGGRPIPAGADPMLDPEMDERGIGILTDFLRFQAPPARAEITSSALRDSVERGEELFDEIGCASCHTPAMRTGTNDVAAMSQKTANLYSDLLLHDLGEENAGICGPHAEPGEYRTTMLWGLRFKENYMHDGSATTLERSIELHGGEGEASQDAFDELSAEEKAFLLSFLRVL